MPESAQDVHFQSLSDVCRQIKSGALTSVSVTQTILARIQTLDSHLHSFVHVFAEEALAQAVAADKAVQEGSSVLGSLHGVPIAIKDLVFTTNAPTASGTLVMRDFVASYDATVLQKLRAAGAVIIGKTQLTEGAFGVHHPEITAPVNPYDAERWTGVSSSGSGVAVAAGMAFAALGSDTGGSIRFPCASCGLVGIKPTYGRVSRHGVFPLAPSLDHIGPMTRTVEDAARVLSAISGYDKNDETSYAQGSPSFALPRPGNNATIAANLRVGIDWAYIQHGVAGGVIEVVKQAAKHLEDAGATLVEVKIPDTYRQLVDDWGLTCGVECAAAHVQTYSEHKGLYGPVLSSLIELGRSVSPDKYAELEGVRRVFGDKFESLFRAGPYDEGIDVFLCPAMVSPVPTVVEMERSGVADQLAPFITFTAPFDYSGHPTINLPMGFDSIGLPHSVQLIAKRYDEQALIDAGSVIESTFGFSPPAEIG